MSQSKTVLVRDLAPAELPEELVCPICKKLMECASLVPCCAKAYCDDCKLLLELFLLIASFSAKIWGYPHCIGSKV